MFLRSQRYQAFQPESTSAILGKCGENAAAGLKTHIRRMRQCVPVDAELQSSQAALR
jgi:hypothetical protein